MFFFYLLDIDWMSHSSSLLSTLSFPSFELRLVVKDFCLSNSGSASFPGESSKCVFFLNGFSSIYYNGLSPIDIVKAFGVLLYVLSLPAVWILWNGAYLELEFTWLCNPLNYAELNLRFPGAEPLTLEEGFDVLPSLLGVNSKVLLSLMLVFARSYFLFFLFFLLSYSIFFYSSAWWNAAYWFLALNSISSFVSIPSLSRLMLSTRWHNLKKKCLDLEFSYFLFLISDSGSSVSLSLKS